MMEKTPEVAIVDDDQILAESLRDLLESVGHKVCTFLSAGDFLESGRLMQIDCLVTDIDMPAIDGFELANIVHASRPVLPVIFITGKSDVAELLGGRFFRKPFEGLALLGAIADTINKH